METIKKHKIHQERSFVVRRTESGRRARLLIIPFAILLLPLLASFATYYHFGSEERELARHIYDLEAELANVENQLNLAEQMRANAEVASEVDQYAIEELRRELVVWSNKFGQQEETIKFYQSLMDPNPTNSGVYLESVEIDPTDEENVFNYKILVAQKSSNHRRVNGSVQLDLISKKNSDGIQTISLKELTEDADDLTLGFKFFQQFDGNFRLPAGFEPGQLKLVVRIQGNSAAQFEELVDWAVRS